MSLVLYFTKGAVPTAAETKEFNDIRGQGGQPLWRNGEFVRADQAEAPDFVAGTVPDIYANVPVYKTKGGKSKAELEREAETAAKKLKNKNKSLTDAEQAEADKLAAEEAAKGTNPFGDGTGQTDTDAEDDADEETAADDDAEGEDGDEEEEEAEPAADETPAPDAPPAPRRRRDTKAAEPAKDGFTTK